MSAADALQPEGVTSIVRRWSDKTPVKLLIAIAQEGIARSDADIVFSAFDALVRNLETMEAERRRVEMVENGAVTLFVKAVEAFGETNFGVLAAGCKLLCSFTFMQRPPPRITGALITVLRVLLRAQPPADPADATLRLECLAEGLLKAKVDEDAALRAAVVDVGAVEELVFAGVVSESPCPFLLALIVLCGPSATPPDDCTRRMIRAGALGLAVGASRAWDNESENEIAVAGAALLDRLQAVALAGKAPDDVFVSAFQAQEDAIFDALLCGLAGPALARERWASSCVYAISLFAMSAAGGLCAQRFADRVVDAVVATLRKMLPEHAASARLASRCAYTLNAFAGGCSGGDAAAPGTRALCAGALPLLESMLPAVQAELAGGGLDKATRKQYAGVAEYVRKLRALAARREKAAAALIAEEEAEQARRSKAAQGGKAKGSKASKTKAKQPQMQQVAAVLAAVSLADAGAAPAEPPPAPQPAPPQPAPPVLPPPPPPLPQPAPAAPPPLPPWLQQAMQQPPPLPPAEAQASTRGRARPAISGLSAGEVPRELECAICLDARAEGRTPCCGQTAFCAPCAATLRAECPLCRALPGAA